MTFFQAWYGYTASFERVLEEWSSGNFESVHPGDGLPIGPLYRTLTWSQEQAEKMQTELIGMSQVVEVNQLMYAISRSGVHVAPSTEQTSAYEVETQGGTKGASVVGQESFAMPLAKNS